MKLPSRALIFAAVAIAAATFGVVAVAVAVGGSVHVVSDVTVQVEWGSTSSPQKEDSR